MSCGDAAIEREEAAFIAHALGGLHPAASGLLSAAADEAGVLRGDDPSVLPDEGLVEALLWGEYELHEEPLAPAMPATTELTIPEGWIDAIAFAAQAFAHLGQPQFANIEAGKIALVDVPEAGSVLRRSTWLQIDDATSSPMRGRLTQTMKTSP